VAYILNIDASTTNLYISIAKNGEVLQSHLETENRNHIGILQPTVQQLLDGCNLQLKDLQAIAVINGPGSYTGLRIALSSAKAYAFALTIPIIGVNMLELLADDQLQNTTPPPQFCSAFFPMKNEIIYNVYKNGILLHELQFSSIDSFKALYPNELVIHATTSDKIDYDGLNHHLVTYPYHSLNKLSYKKFSNNIFEELNNIAPLYIKKTYIN
jgi:tRNA threonylcarbamoyladenosine biosynthesis protein TsaB